MKITETQKLVNAICQLNGEADIYDLKNRFEKEEDDELLEIMSKPVDIQMVSLYLKRKDKPCISCYPDLYQGRYQGRYKGRDEKALEKYRLEGLKKIADEKDSLKKIDIFYEYARELKESMNMLNLMEETIDATRTFISFDVCINMFGSGKYTLTEMKTVLPWLQLSDIYGLSKMLGKEMPITEEELGIVKLEYNKSGKPVVLKEMFGEPKISLKDLLGEDSRQEEV